MNVKTALDEVKNLYTGNLAQHGVDSKSVGWKDEASQLLRFDVLSRVIHEGDAPFTVNDFGSGYGAMYAYLDQRFRGLTGYCGVDVSEPMVAQAKTLHPSAKAEFLLTDRLTKPADYGFVSGTFNVCFKATPGEWMDWIVQQLDMLNETSTRGFAFNLLSTYVDWKAENLFYASPLEFFDLCKRRYSRFVTLHHDYPLYEWTIAVRKAP